MAAALSKVKLIWELSKSWPAASYDAIGALFYS